MSGADLSRVPLRRRVVQGIALGSPSPSSAAAFALAAAIPIYYALRGGSYDVVVRQEEAIVVWWLVGLGYAFGLLPRARFARGAWLPLVSLVLLSVWTAVALAWTQSDERTFAEVARVVHFAGLVVLIWALLDRSNWRAAAAGLAVAALFISALAVMSRLYPSHFPANAVHRVFHTNRLNYPFNYWNAVAAWGAMSIAMALAWSAHAARSWVRAASLALIPVCAVAVYLTYSRAGVIGSALAVLLVFALSRNRWVVAVHALAAAGGSWLVIAEVRRHPAIVEATGGRGGGAVVSVLLLAGLLCVLAVTATSLTRADRLRMPRRAGHLTAAAVVVLAVLLAATVGGHRISRAWDEFRNRPVPAASETSSSDPAARLTNLRGNRYPEWKSAVKAFRSEPLHGIGPGTYEFWWNRHGGEEFVRDAHSLYLEELGELGLPGLVLVLSLMGGVVFVALRARSAVSDPAELGGLVAVTAGLFVYLFHAGVDWMWESTAVSVLGLASAAVAASAAARSRGHIPSAWQIRAAVAIIALVACLVELPGLVSASRIRASQTDFRRGDVAGALRAANDAIDSQPWAASPYVQRGLIEESSGELRVAAADLRRAERREPTNWRHPLLLARVEAKLGSVQGALDAYRRARLLRPHSRFFLQSRGASPHG